MFLIEKSRILKAEGLNNQRSQTNIFLPIRCLGLKLKKKKVLNTKQRTLHLVVEEEGEQLFCKGPSGGKEGRTQQNTQGES